MSDEENKRKDAATLSANADRRAALKRLGRFAAVTPPTVVLLLAAKSMPANALAASGKDDVSTPP
jgi:hypothetical protein